MCRRNKALVKDLSTPTGTKDLYFPTQYSESTWGQFKSCLWKQWLTYWRSPEYNLVRYCFTLVCGVLVGTIFWKIGEKRFVFICYLFWNKFQQNSKVITNSLFNILWFRESSSDLITIIGAMYASVLFIGISNCSTVQPMVATERTVFYRERAAGMYSSLPYAMAQVR